MPGRGHCGRNRLNAILLMVHGSPLEESNDDVRKVVDVLRSRKIYDIVEVGFLDVNRPTIPEAIESCVRSGASAIVAVPYFLHAGRHVFADLPALLEEAARKHPALSITMGDYLGRDPILARVLLERAGAARPFLSSR